MKRVEVNNERNTYPLVGVIGIVPGCVKLGLTITTAGSIWERGSIAFISTWWRKTLELAVDLCNFNMYYVSRINHEATWRVDARTSKSIGGTPVTVHHATGVPGSTSGHTPAVVKRLSRLSKPCAWRGFFMASGRRHDLVLWLEPTDNLTEANETEI